MPRLSLSLLRVLLLPFAKAHQQGLSPPSQEPTLQTLEKGLQAAENAAAPNQKLIRALRERLEAIRHEQARLGQALSRINELERSRQSVQQQLDGLSSPPPPGPSPAVDALSVEQLETLLAQAKMHESEARARVESAKLALEHDRQRLAQLTTAPALPTPLSPPPDEPIVLTQAAELLNSTRQQANEAELRAYSLERNLLPLRIRLDEALLHHAESEQTAAREMREHIEQALNARRLSAARETQQEAEEAARYQQDPLLRQLAEDNQQWAGRLTAMTEHLASISQQKEKTIERTQRLRMDMSDIEKRLQRMVVGPVMGNLLLEKRASLPDEADLERRNAKTRAILSEIQLLDFELGRERAQLDNEQAWIAARLEGRPEEQHAALTPRIVPLLADRRAILDQIDALKPSLLLALDDLERAVAEQREVVRRFSELIAEHLLWMPNARPIWSAIWTSPSEWSAVFALITAAKNELRALVEGFQRHPWGLIGSALLSTLLLVLRPRLRRGIERLIDRPQGEEHSAWSPLGVIALAGLIALPWPLLIGSIGQHLQANTSSGGLLHGLGFGLLTIAPPLLYARTSLALFQSHGPAERLFHWSRATLGALRSAMRLFIWGVLPLGFLGAINFSAEQEILRDVFGRLAFMGALLMLALVFGRLLHPRGDLMLNWRMLHARHWTARLASLWLTLGIGLPLLFAALAAIGYFYSAGILTQKLMTSLWLGLALMVIYDIALRMLRQAQRRIESQREHAAPARSGNESEGHVPAASGMDVEQISRQSRKLLNFSMVIALALTLYAVWAPILPALGIFDQIQLWDYQGEIKGEAVTISVSLGNLLLSILLLLVMWVAARNLPGLMEILLEQWTAYDSGTRYAIITISRYLIVGIGLLMILGGLGLQWSQMQWLVAALGVGLGFGLQEIFANFVSGLIILFERPVRVGDLVTIGDKTGFIKRIHIRATVLEDYDRREIVVPNRALITEQVVNWTLSDTTTRVIVDVGVAYGTDPRKVEAVLLHAAASVKSLLADPAPLVWFTGFGDNALNFRLRAFVGDADNRLGASSDLHYAIEQGLRENGIEIPFPQRDIHIRDISGLPPSLFKEPKPYDHG